MQIQIESTGKVCEIDGQTCRHWKGTTAKGISCDVFVAVIATNTIDDAEFEAELNQTTPPKEYTTLDRILNQ